MEVRDRVGYLKILLNSGLIENAKPIPEGMGNSFLVTSGGCRESEQPR